ncbi:MAG: 2-dehydropantoate 2-reductase [Gemmatimonadaceae bacterium]
MRVLIVGAGALGGLVGAMLTRAGEDVTLLEVNAARAHQLNTDGLQIARSGGGESITVPLRVVTSVEGLDPFDLVFIAVKTYQTEDAVRAALPAARADTLFLSMQNGVGNAELVAGLVGPERVLCGITYHSVQHVGPGRLQFRAGIKPIQIAPFDGVVTPAIDAIGEMFRAAGLDTTVVANIDHAVWQKLLHNASINPVSAITGLTCREILGDEDLLAFMRDLCAEIVAVMRARGVPIVDEEDPFRPLLGSLTALGNNRPTMWQDLARGVRTEIDALNGVVVAEAGRLGLRAPHNAALVRFVHSRERQKFLNRQNVSRALGLDAASVSKRAAAGSRRTPGSAGSEPWNRQDVPALESTRRLREIIRVYHRDVAAASDDPDRFVAATSCLAPVEIVRALGIVPWFPENRAARIGARHEAARYMALASAEGFSPFSSSAMRTDIGALLSEGSAFAATDGTRGTPRCDVALYSTNTGQELPRWFEFYGAHFGVPVAGLCPPPAVDKMSSAEAYAATEQLLRLVEQVERATGLTLFMDRLSETVAHTVEAARLWGDVLELASAVPAPLTFGDMLTHMTPMILLRGTPEAAAYYRLLKSEVEERVASGIAAVSGERHRFYWDGPPVWSALRPVTRIFADHGVSIVAATDCERFTLPGLDALDPIESVARTYAGVFGNRSQRYQSDFLASRFERFGVDAAVFHDSRTTPEGSHVRYGLAVRTEQQTGVPALVIEADSHDDRLFSADRMEQQLAEFLERHELRPARLAAREPIAARRS